MCFWDFPPFRFCLAKVRTSPRNQAGSTLRSGQVLPRPTFDSKPTSRFRHIRWKDEGCSDIRTLSRSGNGCSLILFLLMFSFWRKASELMFIINSHQVHSKEQSHVWIQWECSQWPQGCRPTWITKTRGWAFPSWTRWMEDLENWIFNLFRAGAHCIEKNSSWGSYSFCKYNNFYLNWCCLWKTCKAVYEKCFKGGLKISDNLSKW